MTFKLLERLSSSLGTWTFRYNPIVLEYDAPGVSKAVVEDIMTFSLQPKPIKFSRVQRQCNGVGPLSFFFGVGAAK